jgi:hypothetical protein
VSGRRRQSAQAAFESAVLARADRFYATAYLGLGRYDVREAATIEAAREAARDLYIDRPVAIYASDGQSKVHVENYDPRR